MFGTSKAMVAAVASLLAGAGALVSPASAAAQEPTTVTGCLSKGAAEGTFSIKGTDDKSYSLTSTSVKLDGHVGHKVTVTGTPAGVETGAVKDTGAAAAKDTGIAPDTGMKHEPGMKHDTGMKEETGAAGEGALNVTSLKMDSAECS
ncbi:MAG: hypothetical protein ACREOC_05200 [Gemmatimonadales bacterium]